MTALQMISTIGLTTLFTALGAIGIVYFARMAWLSFRDIH